MIIIDCTILLRIILIDCPELDSTLPTPVDSLIEQLSLSYGPKNQPMILLDKHTKRLSCKRQLLSYPWVFVGNNCTIKIDCNFHTFSD